MMSLFSWSEVQTWHSWILSLGSHHPAAEISLKAQDLLQKSLVIGKVKFLCGRTKLFGARGGCPWLLATWKLDPQRSIGYDLLQLFRSLTQLGQIYPEASLSTDWGFKLHLSNPLLYYIRITHHGTHTPSCLPALLTLRKGILQGMSTRGQNPGPS